MIRAQQSAHAKFLPSWPLCDGFLLRELRSTDTPALVDYFHQLGVATRRRFQPHPLTPQVAKQVCTAPGGVTLRLVIEHASRLVAYFIVDTMLSEHERRRYGKQGIALAQGLDFLFAPSVHDDWQNKGLASLAMPYILEICRAWGAHSLVLMGGTQATNARAIFFYEKFGFTRHGGYQTEVFNHDMRLLLQQPVNQVSQPYAPTLTTQPIGASAGLTCGDGAAACPA